MRIPHKLSHGHLYEGEREAKKSLRLLAIKHKNVRHDMS